jgi:hypothetical protein
MVDEILAGHDIPTNPLIAGELWLPQPGLLARKVRHVAVQDSYLLCKRKGRRKEILVNLIS